MRTPAPVACDAGVRLVVGASGEVRLLCSLLLLVEHSVRRIHSGLLLVGLILNFFHSVCLELDQLLLLCIVRAGGQCEGDE